jgi:hypothetical protein
MKLVSELEAGWEDDVDKVWKENKMVALEMVIYVWF